MSLNTLIDYVSNSQITSELILSEYKLNHCFCTNGRISKNESLTNNLVVLFLIIKKIFFLI